MNIGLFLGDQPFGSDDPSRFVEIAQAAESAGFDSVWLGDHPVRPLGDPTNYPYATSGRRPQRTEDSLFDPIVTLAYLAGTTSRILLGTAIYILPLRHPLVVARELMTLDRASGGRVLFGVGAGWLEDEFRALGIPFEGRGRRMDDSIRLLRQLWTEEVVASESSIYPFDSVVFRPPPLQRPHPPILVGGHSFAALRRAARLGDGWIPVAPDLEELSQLLRTLEELLAAAGRSRHGFLVHARTPGRPSAAELDRYEEFGLDGIRVHAADIAGRPLHECKVDDVLRGIDRFANDVLARREAAAPAYGERGIRSDQPPE